MGLGFRSGVDPSENWQILTIVSVASCAGALAAAPSLAGEAKVSETEGVSFE